MSVRRPSLIAAAVPPRVAGAAALAVAGVGVAGAAGVMAGIVVLAALVLIGQWLLAWSWTRRQRASAGTAAIVAGASVACDVTLLVRESTQIGDLVGVVGAGVVVVVLYQLARRRVRATSNGTVASGAATVVRGNPGEPARVTVDMAAGLSGVGLVALLAVVLALDARDGGAGGTLAAALAAAGLLGVGVGVGVSRLVAVTMARLRAGDARVEADGCVGAAAGVVAGAVAGAVLGALAGVSSSEGAAVAVAGAAAALAVERGLARGLLMGGGVGETPAGPSQAPATPPISVGSATPPISVGSATPPISVGPVPASVSVALAALLPFAMAAPVVYLVGRLFIP